MYESVFSRPAADRVKLSMRIDAEPDDEMLLLGEQLGVDCCYVWVGQEQTNARFLSRLASRLADHGLTLYNAGNLDLGKCDDIILGTEQRDERIRQFSRFVNELGEAGVGVTTFTWEQVPTGTWNSPQPATTRGTPTRHVSMADVNSRPFTHSRRYTEQEIWDNFAYFVERVLPVAERAGVRLSLHPNDPPVDELGGVACLVKSIDSYRRAFEIGGSPNLGMEFCTGCWLEGGTEFGNVAEGIAEFGGAGRINIIHFRNIDAPLPEFHETFLDNGYMDMYVLARAIAKVGYTGTVTLDHIPRMAGGRGDSVGLAYGIGYLKALFERAYAEVEGR